MGEKQGLIKTDTTTLYPDTAKPLSSTYCSPLKAGRAAETTKAKVSANRFIGGILAKTQTECPVILATQIAVPSQRHGGVKPHENP
jgi:hypothetical protein